MHPDADVHPEVSQFLLGAFAFGVFTAPSVKHCCCHRCFLHSDPDVHLEVSDVLIGPEKALVTGHKPTGAFAPRFITSTKTSNTAAAADACI
jgi:hypothetical protein